MKRERLACSLLALGIVGCTAPGHLMSVPSYMDTNIMPITGELLGAQEAARQRTPAKLPSVSSLQRNERYAYRIGPNDVLSIIVWEHPELTSPAGKFGTAEEGGRLVSPDGTIFFPYAGTVRVAGKTAEEIRAMLTNALARVIENPQLDVRVVAYRSQKIWVVGEVETPGPLAITDVPTTVLDAISKAGRVTERADLVHATLSRDGKLYAVNLLAIYENGDMADNILLKGGDALHIPDRSRQRVYVLGEVPDPTTLVIDDGTMNLTEALGGAGFANPETAAPAYTYVIRGTAEKPRIFRLYGKSPAAFVLADQFQLKPQDVVYVESKQLTRWSRVLNLLLPVRIVNPPQI
jgi:polysaccharide biosynthesis/export protein